MNDEKFLIDINDESNWLRVIHDQRPGQPLNEIMRQVILPEGPERNFEFTDSIFYGGSSYHEHAFGWETFFLTKGRMDFTVHGKTCTCEAGDIIVLQPYCAHQMTFLEEGHWRGVFHDMGMSEIQNNYQRVMKYNAERSDYSMITTTYLANPTNIVREPAVSKRVDRTEVYEVRNAGQYLNRFDFDGLTMKQMSARWEQNGVTEMWRLEMADAFAVKYGIDPKQDLFYAESGEVEFHVGGQVFTAYHDCLVKIPSFVPRSFISKGPSVMYDIGGTTHWLDAVEDYLSIRQYKPEFLQDREYMDKVLHRHNCFVESFGIRR